MVEMDMPATEEEEEALTPSEEQEIETVLYAIGKEAVKNVEAENESRNGHSNGNGHIKKEKKEKPDLEIPRKVLHSSIGWLSCIFSVISCLSFSS